MESEKRATRSLRDLCLSASFAIFLVAPVVALCFEGTDAAPILAENRTPAAFPSLPQDARAGAQWPREFEAWHDDHFGLRTSLVRAHNALKIFGLGTSPSPRIVVGRERWIYSTAFDIDLWRGATPFSRAELEAWRLCLESRQRELAARGMAYSFVLAPSKAAVYPEFLPRKFRKAGPSRTDQLVEYLAANSSFRIVDLRAALLQEKRNDAGDDTTYYPLGTHWNDRGALAGLRAIVAELAVLRPEVGAIGDVMVEQVPRDDLGDSWAVRLYLSDLLTQPVRRVILSDARTRIVKLSRLPKERTIVVDQDDPALPRAVVFHDSFGEPLAGTLGRHFSHSMFVWKPEIDIRLLEAERPDFVLHVFSDRVLATLQPQALQFDQDRRVLEQYEASSEVALRYDVGTNSPPIAAFSDASVVPRPVGSMAQLACTLNSAAGGFLLPEFKLRPGTHAVVRLEFESPIAAGASVLFQTRTEPNYHRRRQLHFDVHQGSNVLHVELIDPGLTGKLLFRPANEAGTFLLRALEVRLVGN